MSKRTKFLRRIRRQAHGRRQVGLPPGTVTVDPSAPKPVLQVMAFSPEAFVEREIAAFEELRKFLAEWPAVWVNVDGLGDAEILHQVAALFHMHPLALEDVVSIHQRSKVEQYGDETFIVTHMVSYKEHLEAEQLSLYLGANFVVTFQQEPEWDPFDPVRDRLRKGLTQLRQRGSAYLAYSLIDAVIDHCFPVLENYSELLEDLEDRILTNPTRSVMEEIHTIKRELLHLRRILWPQREALNMLLRDPIPHIDAELRLYLRDCYDHTLRIIDLIETYREVCSDLTDLYLSSVSNRMNEVMKVLTVISTLFIPLTFIVGVYGMNFDPDASPWNMPEVKWYWGYPVCLGVMLVISLCQLMFFRRKGWIGPNRDR